MFVIFLCLIMSNYCSFCDTIILFFSVFSLFFIGKIWYSLSYYGRVCNRQLSITKISTQLRRIIMKITEKTRRFIRSIALIVLPITLILSLSSVILKVYTQYTEDKLFKELSENISVAEKVHDEHSIDSSVSSINSENVTPAILSEYSELHNENPDLYGWLQINDTVIDYPVMYSPYDPQLYLYKNFYKEDSKSGTPFILTPSSTNTIIYGHNMKNASMFSSLLKYKDIEFWKTHRYIIFNTLTSKGIYEISIVANEIVYYDEAKIPDGAYLFYKHSNLDSKGDFDEYVNELKKNSYFDSNISLEYGDELLTLVTCDYVQENSRLVVVAKKIN